MKQPGSRAWFEAYLAAFNGDDFDGFGAYYADDVAFHGRAATLTGRNAILDFYRGVKERLEENLELLTFVGSPDRVAVEVRTTLRPYEDWLDFPTGPLKAGELRQSINFAFYDIADGKFTRIRSAGFARIA
ncbi:nuclear transport factor 2 family protein [Parasphingopyxis marina]|uniref:Nuclear transport factor 2 family protein n=1 Tax=Parasphingopyxis marina TaxID=2761622 RepID=A0A842HQK3_9SPHN|nr:nuclear transport factor 2 family protein [Parasphingopyxis marina]MBC2776018.1 nuclear transport factor 2 family protein [Parasphingopyxis marina]